MKKRIALIAFLLIVVIGVAAKVHGDRERAIVNPDATTKYYVLIFGQGSNKQFSTVISGPNLDAAMHQMIGIKSLDPATPDQIVNYTAVEVSVGNR